MAAEAGAAVSAILTEKGAGQRGDRIFKAGTMAFALGILAIVGALGAVLLVESRPAFSAFGIPFLWSTQWNPVTEQFGALTAVWGTLVSSLLAILIATPVGLGIAVFLTEVAPRWLAKPVGVAVEMLAAVPSIIYGMWGLFILAPVLARTVQPWLKARLGFLPLFQGPPMGISMMAGALILAIMILPFIASVTKDVLSLVPAMAKESAYGLGATTWEVVRHVVLPYARSGVVGAVFLGLGRALGETMAITFVIGNAHRLSLSLLAPSTTISATLANEFTEATSDLHLSSLMALGLILFLITSLILSLAKIMLWRISRGREGGRRS